jgi:hypothetical protein
LALNPKPTHETFSSSFVPYLVPELDGSTSMIDTVPIPEANRFGIATTENSNGFSYLLWDSDVRYVTDVGQKQLPLSKHRVGPSPGYAIETAAIVPLHAPIAQRVIKIIASRNGNWPSIPNPIPAKTDPTTLREVLVSKKEVLDTPKLDSDNANMIYSIQLEWTYALARPPEYALFTGGALTAAHKMKTMSSPIDKTTPVSNQFTLYSYIDPTSSIDN